MNLPKHCVVIIKQSALQHAQAQGGSAVQLAQQGDATAKRLLHADAEHQRTIATVRQTLAKFKIEARELNFPNFSALTKRQIARADFLITIGGDGTVLNTSHYVRAGVLLGVNSAPGDSVGHFCSVTRHNFAAQLKAALLENWQPTLLARLSIKLAGKTLPELALNDVLIAHDCPAATTRYLIKIDEQEEEHRSSGIWISTAAGSTAGIFSAGGRKMPLSSTKIQFLVRELYREIHGGQQRDYELVKGQLAAGKTLTIASKMNDGWLYVDGARTAYRFPFGMRAEIGTAPDPLRIFRPTA